MRQAFVVRGIMLGLVCFALVAENGASVPRWVSNEARSAHLALRFPVETLMGTNGVRFYMVSPPRNDRGLIDYRIGAFSPGRLKLIHRMEDLRGLVAVSTPTEALELARLRTDPATTWTFERDLGMICFEVMDSTDLPPYFGLGQRPAGSAVGRFRHGYEGGLTHREFTTLGFHTASAEREAGGFVIHRSVVYRQDDKTVQCANITEQVGRDGRYRVEWHKVDLPTMDGVNWDLSHPKD